MNLKVPGADMHDTWGNRDITLKLVRSQFQQLILAQKCAGDQLSWTDSERVHDKNARRKFWNLDD